MSESKRTPHDIAIEIAKNNLELMKSGSGNKDGVGGGEQAAGCFLALIARGLCSSCARLAVDQNSQIGCSFDFNSPSAMARPLLDGTFLHEQQCSGHISEDNFEVFTDDDGVTRYRYK